MKLKYIFKLVTLMTLALTLSIVGFAQKKSKSNVSKEISRSQNAATSFKKIMNAPDKAIPQTVLDKAECVAVFPRVLKAAFIFGGRGGKGLVSCQTENGWSAPVYLTMAGGSFGWQIGAQSTDFVLLFMNRKGIDSLLDKKLTLGADISVAAGPVGRQAGASTDIGLEAQILSYSRTRGIFAGVALKGVVISMDKSAMNKLYGKEQKHEDTLDEKATFAPLRIRVFSETIGRYSKRNAD